MQYILQIRDPAFKGSSMERGRATWEAEQKIDLFIEEW